MYFGLESSSNVLILKLALNGLQTRHLKWEFLSLQKLTTLTLEKKNHGVHLVGDFRDHHPWPSSLLLGAKGQWRFNMKIWRITVPRGEADLGTRTH